MIVRSVKNPAASIRAQLLAHAKRYGEDYQRILTRFAIERLLFRLAQTEASANYVLKGAMLFATWPEQAFRPTGDLDLLGQGDSAPSAIADLFTHICAVDVPQDGIVFMPETLAVEVAQEANRYLGIRLSLKGALDNARIHVQVDIGFGDHVHPKPTRQTFPSLLPGMPAASILMYPPETVIAEKFEAMIRFGQANGRIKDFHDIWVITRSFPLVLSDLIEAVAGTFQRRATRLPAEMPIGLTNIFAEMAVTRGLWSGFLRRSPPALSPPPFHELQRELRQFFGPVIEALSLPARAKAKWDPNARNWHSP
ncbi:nucleotidyl transferase AbiEii/AbiGii toxin family protein [Achromobacter deleyi]|uniref:nucleotidyl transferase AbiEii/AbiGii toxin family protein n=1 Tax=Achromobacter deleyi TaxID=1353891 RepID=UPI001467E72C|nr:nucleotidyl transferase AbiEii/AbiGii toxin family protein [Achromobacter deleyi]CAB3926021.1 hypothetical protein LMG3412_05797 [Achromobacter deleyi]